MRTILVKKPGGKGVADMATSESHRLYVLRDLAAAAAVAEGICRWADDRKVGIRCRRCLCPTLDL
jgi:hypothetical protein